MSEDNVTISTKAYKKLKLASRKLAALEAGGVDNWDWYSESLEAAGLFDDEEEGDADAD
jgi:hypothetical protein